MRTAILSAGLALVVVLVFRDRPGSQAQPKAEPRSVIPPLPASVPVDFDKDIRALLQERCVGCHGEKKQKGGLRLDAKRFAFKGGDEGPAIVAGASAKSSLFQRIRSTEDSQRMPPKGDPLSSRQIALIKAWIDAGAVWPENKVDQAAAVDKRLRHWSVQPVKKEFPPEANIDYFLRAKLAEKGLAMSPEADPRTLIRRLYFDLIGLPPTPEEVERFVQESQQAQSAHQAYERLVDKLLQSPHYGERWAQHWLDIAHYADTHGFERDQLRPNAWRYRDYVIDALNADKPYNQFLREQIAGDVLTPNDPQAVIATGFLAAGPWDFVGQVETKSPMLQRAAQALDLDDMVTQVITATMGITINCARCHEHKLDPIAQEDYYRLWAVFAGVKRGDRDVDQARSRRLAAEKARLSKELAQTRAEIAKLTGKGLDLADMAGGGDGHGTGVKGRGIHLRTGNLLRDKVGHQSDILPNRLQKIEWPGNPDTALRLIQAVFVPDGRGTVLVAPKREVKGVPATSGDTWDVIRNGPLHAQHSTRINGVDYATEGHSILGMHANSGITLDLQKIRQGSGLDALRFTAVLGFGAAPAAADSRADFSVFVDTELKFQRLKMRKDAFALLDVVVPAKARTLTLFATDGGDGINDDLLFLGDPQFTPETGPAKPTDADRLRVKELHAQADSLVRELRALPEQAKVYAVVPTDKPPVTRVQRRGNPEDPQQEVVPGAFSWVSHAPAAFGDNTTSEGQRRRALADWIAHPDNPLTRRVMMNRLWHHHFGQGIVNTPSDFGLGGDRPSHPELLDYLADEFLKKGWSLKHMHKRIVMSAAYRQQSTTHSAKASRLDSGNRLLWRQNSRRLTGESLRDAVLSVSGKLNAARGGPGYRDFRYTEAYVPIYDYFTPDKPALWRRSIYRFVVRTTPHQFLSTLDCPNPANLTPARAQTTTALQALALSNNEFMLQQAQHLAKRIETETGERPAAIRRAFALCFGRPARQAEVEAASPLVAKQGLFALCRMLLNANEFLYID